MTAAANPGAQSLERLFERYGSRYRAYAILTIGVGTIATILSSTSVNVAIPPIMGAFGISQNVAQWLSSGYLAAATVTMLCTTWALTRFGIRTTFIANMAIFLLASLLGALSRSTEALILARVIQGAASGFFLPLSMVLLGRIFPAEKQGMAMGLFGIIAVMAPAFGPYIGGLLIDAFNWRYTFYMVVPLGLASVPLALLFLPERDPKAPRTKLDVPSVVLLSLSITLLLLGFSRGQAEGWGSDYVRGCFGLMMLTGVGFLLRQPHCATALLDLRLFRQWNFSLAMIVTLVFGAGLYASFYTTPLFLQTVQGLNATEAGFVLMPGGVVLALLFPLTGHLSDRTDPRLLIGLGLLVFAYSFWVMVAADRQTGLWLFAGWVILGRIGLGAIMPSLNVAALAQLPRELQTPGASCVNFMRQLGGALGVNLSAVLLERRTAVHTEAIAASQHFGHETAWETLATWLEPLQAEGIDTLTQLPLAAWLLGREFFRQGLALGFQDTFAISAWVVLLALLPVLLLRPARAQIRLPLPRAKASRQGQGQRG